MTVFNCSSPRIRKTTTDKFWSRVDQRAPDECWPWMGSRNAKGYGRFWANGRAAYATHYALWVDSGADVPPGMIVCHSCDNPSCVNPAHLWIGTVADNHHDAMAKGRNTKGSRHGEAKLTEADVVRIRHGAARGVSGTALADEFGVSSANIYLIVHRRGWVHVD